MAVSLRVPGPVTAKIGAAELGCSKNGFIIRPQSGWTPVTDDCHGAEPWSFIFSGKSAIISFVGLDVTKLTTAAIWQTGLLNASGIGALASAVGKTLSIWERTSNPAEDDADWVCKVVAQDPAELALRSTQELLFPTTFLVVPVNGKLFSKVPTYLQAAA